MSKKTKQALMTIVLSPALVLYGVGYVVREVASVWWYDFKLSFRGVRK